MSDTKLEMNRQTARKISHEFGSPKLLEGRIFTALQIAQNRGKAIAEFKSSISKQSSDRCTECGSFNIRIDNRDRPDRRLDGHCFNCLHEWSCKDSTLNIANKED